LAPAREPSYGLYNVFLEGQFGHSDLLDSVDSLNAARAQGLGKAVECSFFRS
jgi:hypothetical protein